MPRTSQHTLPFKVPSLIDSQLIQWANDGTLRSWYEAYDLLYDLA